MGDKVLLEDRLGMFDELKWKYYSQWDIIETKFIDTDWTNRNLEFDISKHIFSIDDIKFKLELPSSAILTRIEFHENKIVLTGKVSFFSGSGETNYGSFISFIDDALVDGIAHLSTNSGVTKLSKVD